MISLPLETTVESPDAMRALCGQLDQELLRLHSKSILLLEGDLGAGKTTFCSGFREVLGLGPRVTSPSFNLLNVYESPKAVLYHYDLYRLHPAEIPELGFIENWTRSPGTVREIHAIEWWQRAEGYIPTNPSTFLITFRPGATPAPDSTPEREERVVTVRVYS